MKKLNRLFAAAVLPFTLPMAIEQWTPVHLPSRELPEVESKDGEWHIVTHGGAGGYAYLLPEPGLEKDPRMKISWRWSVLKFPKTNPSVPFDKKNDDYALRVGVLIADTDENIKVPASIEKLLKAKGVKLSYVVFYNTVGSKTGASACGISPYNDYIVNCLKHATDREKLESASPIEDAMKHFGLPEAESEKLKIIGVWIFADSDNSNSESEAKLNRIQFLK